jgi:hypothetical protein
MYDDILRFSVVRSVKIEFCLEMMDTVGSSRTLLSIYQPQQCHNLEEQSNWRHYFPLQLLKVQRS